MKFYNLRKNISGVFGLFLCSSLLVMNPLSVKAEEIPAEHPIFTEAPAETPAVTEAPAEFPSVTETPTVTEAPAESPSVTEVPAVTEAPVESPSATEVPAVTAVPAESPVVTAAPTGEPKVLKGLVRDGKGNLYYYKDGKAVSSVLKKIKGNYYYFGKKGKAVKGLKKINGAKYYFSGKTGKAVRGLKKISGNTYYFGKNGRAVTGLKKINRNLYYFRASGKALKGKKMTINGRGYYFGSSGKAKLDGWVDIGLVKYYAGVKGTLQYYWKQVDGVWRLRNLNGENIFSSNTLYRAWTRVQSMTSATSYFLAVDTSACRTMVFRGAKGKWVPEKYWICSPGKSSSPTVKGVFTVGSKGYCFGRGFTCYYFTQFHGNYLFHSVLYYQGTFRKQDGRLGQHLSHGCVRLDISNAKWIYNNVPRGTKVYTYA